MTTTPDSTPTPSSDAPAARKRRWPRLAVFGGIGLVVVIAASLVFQPWRLFIDNVVDEALPGTPTAETTEPGGTGEPAAAVSVETSTSPGEFVDKDHPASGTARIVTLSDGMRIVRLEDFATDNGPDLFVYLSPADASVTGDALAEGAVNLGVLKGNIGNQNYEIPADVDLAQFKSVVIWCRQFSSAFGAAPIVG